MQLNTGLPCRMIPTLARRRLATTRRGAFISVLLLSAAGLAQAAEPARWEIPLPGNTFLTSPAERGGDRVERDALRWREEASVFSIFFRVDRPAELNLALRLCVPKGESVVRLSALGRDLERKATGPDAQTLEFGRVRVERPGYVRVDLRGVSRTGPTFADASHLVVTSPTDGAQADFVKDNQQNRYYWGRRGPSVHLGYELPRDRTLEYFHSEITVPEGEDPIGSYFMANGFGEGYFGIQGNSPTERRVLFSVWSPFRTDNPAAIPEDQRIVMLKRGEGVQTGEFGNEGSGGQSFLRYPWKAGNTYRFLTRAAPDGQGSTIYTAWFFAPEAGQWKLIASFKRPKTDKHLTGLHSFLENFSDAQGWRERRGWHGNQWARDTEGQWHELTRARFTGDDIAQRGYRKDFAGGAEGSRFFLKNGGFFNDTVPLRAVFERQAHPAGPPQVDFAALE